MLIYLTKLHYPLSIKNFPSLELFYICVDFNTGLMKDRTKCVHYLQRYYNYHSPLLNHCRTLSLTNWLFVNFVCDLYSVSPNTCLRLQGDFNTFDSTLWLKSRVYFPFVFTLYLIDFDYSPTFLNLAIILIIVSNTKCITPILAALPSRKPL